MQTAEIKRQTLAECLRPCGFDLNIVLNHRVCQLALHFFHSDLVAHQSAQLNYAIANYKCSHPISILRVNHREYHSKLLDVADQLHTHTMSAACRRTADTNKTLLMLQLLWLHQTEQLNM